MKSRRIQRPSLVPLVFFLVGGGGCVKNAYRLQIHRHNSVAITDARADEILASMTEILQTNDGAGDVACDVRFERDGNITTFSTGDAVINSSADFNAVNRLPGNVKVVSQINWCGGFSPGIIGCAPVPGDSLVIVRFAADQEGVLWVHEFGHNQGLSHRDVANAVMRPFIGTTHRRINASECASYR